MNSVPHVALKSRGLSLSISISIILCFISLAAVPAAAQNLLIDNEEQYMLKLINEYRGQRKLSQLKISVALTRAAEFMSTDMAVKCYFSHTDSMGRDPFVRMSAFKYDHPGQRGENLAAGFGDAVRTFNQWKNSRSHNVNMLRPNFNVIGISRVYRESSPHKWYWTTDFGSHIDTLILGMAEATKRNLKKSEDYFYYRMVPSRQRRREV
ncbi:MAG: CAP domain-containing protein [Acidobacteria bacterium]|nr:CAP domain-containing protein [Acidobacteriota bacterium]